MENFYTQLRNIILECIQNQFEIIIDKIILSTPPKLESGDIATPVVFQLAKILKKNPAEIAEKLKSALLEYNSIDQVNIVNSFLNITLNSHFILECVQSEYQNKNSYYFPDKNININLEFISANPTGPLHIGHGRWAVIGDSLARILSRLGYNVHKEFYLNDAGNQIQKLKESVQALRDNKPIPEDGYHGEYLQDALNSTLEPQIFFLEEHKRVLKTLNVIMDQFYSEKSLIEEDNVQKTIDSLKEKGHTYTKDGATWFASSQLGDDKDRVLIKSDGNYTYFAPDVAYHYTKMKRGANWIIDILGADHHGYIRRMTAAVSALSSSSVQFNVLLGQMVNLFKDGVPIRMSKRAGNIITLEEVIEEIGADATRFHLLGKKINQTIDFDLSIVRLKNKDNHLFYIQYAFARIHSILKGCPEVSTNDEFPSFEQCQLEECEKSLLLHALAYQETLLLCKEEMEPFNLVNYILEMAFLFHKFYEKVKVVENKKPVMHRIIIIKYIASIIEDVFDLLSLNLPREMF